MSGLNYERDINIDDQALDVEWLEQPELMRRYAQHVARMKRERGRAKERLEVTEAELDADIRANPDNYNMAKTTEAAIENTVILQEEYQQRAADYREARYEYDMAVAAVRAMDQRKTALENLVKLLGMSYFAGPQAPRDLSQEWTERQERRTANKNVKITRTRKGDDE